jgi:DNA invertase Pin-like site-specific DNA recombinase
LVAAARRGGKRVGYIRVSSVDQNTGRQLDGLDLDKTFTDKASGKDVRRPHLLAALEYLRDGDVLVVHSMDRLCRNLDDLRRIVTDLTGRGVQVQFMKEGLLFTGEDSAMSKLLLSVMGAFAEFERALLKERQREGIAIAKKAGVYRGRKPSLTPDRVQELRARVASGEKKAALARDFSISRETLYQYVRLKPKLGMR